MVTDTGNVFAPSQVSPAVLIKLVVVMGLIYLFQFLIYNEQILDNMLIFKDPNIGVPILGQIITFLIWTLNAFAFLTALVIVNVPDVPVIVRLILAIINVSLFAGTIIYAWPFISVIAGYIWNAFRWVYHISVGWIQSIFSR
jgi:hypothetical protein